MGQHDGWDLLVVGLGYVGLPLAAAAQQAGLAVAGYDVDAEVVAALHAGRSRIDDVDDATVAAMVDAGFVASDDPQAARQARAVVICVPTPLAERGTDTPDLAAVRAAATTVAPHLARGATVVLESTTYPGTTEDELRPLLEVGSGMVAGVDFHLAFSPERIDPGNKDFGVANTPKVVGGLTPACTEAAAALYGRICDTVVTTTSPREAEMAKLLENTYRHVNIALVNEMAVFCDELGVDLWESIAAASTKPFGYQPFYPGPGVGGHCIPIDPSYLGYKVRTLGYPFRFVELAQEINQRMPGYVVQRIQRLLNDHKRPVNGSRVLLLGVTYKPDVADERESPAVPVAGRLAELGADLAYHDPYVATWRPGGESYTCVEHLDVAVADADIVVLLQPHRSYDLDAIAAGARLLFDTRGVVTDPRAARL